MFSFSLGCLSVDKRLKVLEAAMWRTESQAERRVYNVWFVTTFDFTKYYICVQIKTEEMGTRYRTGVEL
jgi:hypothetical protein